MKNKMIEASSQRVENLQAAAWRAMEKFGWNDLQARQWDLMKNDPYAMQDHIIRAAQAKGLTKRDDIDAFAAKFISDMDAKFGG